MNKMRASSVIPSSCTWPWGWVQLFQNTGVLSVELSSAIPPDALALAPHSCKTLFLSCSHLESWSVMLWVQPLRNNLCFPVMLFTEGGGKRSNCSMDSSVSSAPCLEYCCFCCSCCLNSGDSWAVPCWFRTFPHKVMWSWMSDMLGWLGGVTNNSWSAGRD